MLKYFYDNDLIRYSDKTITDWEEAIEESCQILMEKKMIDQRYVDEIIRCVNEYGPYIVIVPEVAIPHSSGESEGVFDTAISFTKMKNPVVFDPSDSEKVATLFFTLAAKNPEEHMENIQNLSEMLMEEGLIEKLVKTNNIEDYKLVMEEYNSQ